MNTIDVNKRLHEIAQKGHENGIYRDIAVRAIEEINPAMYLKEFYGDNSFLFDFDEQFFFTHAEEVYRTLEYHPNIEVKLTLTLQNYPSELGFLVYQISLQNLMIELGMIEEEDAIY